MSHALADRVRTILSRRFAGHLGQAAPERFHDPETGHDEVIVPLMRVGGSVYGIAEREGRWWGWVRDEGRRDSWERDRGGNVGTREHLTRRYAALFLDTIVRDPEGSREILDPTVQAVVTEILQVRAGEQERTRQRAVEAQQELDAEARERDDLAAAGKVLKCPRGTVTASGLDTQTPVPGALVCGPLAIHRNLVGTGWAVTHVRSGLSILRGVRSQVLAKGAVTVLLKQADWTRDAKALAKDLAVGDLIRRIRRLVE